MNIRERIEQQERDVITGALVDFLESYMNPAFGALPKNEVELMVLDILEKIGAVDREPQIYELVSKLKVTRSKSRNLIYERELRRSSEEDLDSKVKDLLKNPVIQKSGDLYVLEIENPLVSDHLRSKIQKLGYISDGSFSPSVIKLGLDAVSALIQSYLSDTEIDEVKQALIAAGAPDTSFKGVIKATFSKLATKLASDSGAAAVESASDYISPIIDGAMSEIAQKAAVLFNSSASES
ncbi:TPA: hypothetical protein GRI87_24560 [Vibrio parahaemolyticus]|nr:hypothetical protein [Vibrio parahaemolyticus]HAS6731733.1 hypothetical protein [Vibrio parahaemolyticus]